MGGDTEILLDGSGSSMLRLRKAMCLEEMRISCRKVERHLLLIFDISACMEDSEDTLNMVCKLCQKKKKKKKNLSVECSVNILGSR